MPATLRMRHVAVLPLLLAAVLVSTLFAFTPHAEAATKRTQRIAQAFDIVRAQKGDPYVYGADGPSAFDCSGLIYYSYRKAGVNVPCTSGSWPPPAGTSSAATCARVTSSSSTAAAPSTTSASTPAASTATG